jgi:hypothetical protein
MDEGGDGRGRGCAIAFAAILAVSAVILVVFVGSWVAGVFVGLPAALLIAGLLDPG